MQGDTKKTYLILRNTQKKAEDLQSLLKCMVVADIFPLKPFH